MSFIQALVIFAGLSLDGFVVMMNKGATVRDLDAKKSLLYALIYSVADCVAVVLGYGLSFLLKEIMPDRLEIFTSCLIILAIGVFLTTRAFKYENAEERLDRNFNLRTCFALAITTSLDTFFLGVGFSFIGIGFVQGLILAFAVTFVAIISALRIGYCWGSRYTRAVGMSGGALMVFFSVYLLVRFVFH